MGFNPKKDYLSKEEFIQEVKNKVDKLEILKEGVYGYIGDKYFSVNFSKFKPKVTYSDFEWIKEMFKEEKQVKLRQYKPKEKQDNREVNFGLFKQ